MEDHLAEERDPGVPVPGGAGQGHPGAVHRARPGTHHQLVLSEMPGRKPVLGPDFLQAAWNDLEELEERDSLSGHCCTSPEVQICTGYLHYHSASRPRQHIEGKGCQLSDRLQAFV